MARKLTARILFAAAFGLGLAVSGPVLAAGDAAHPHGPEKAWSFEGVYGKYDRAALQRGFQVYKEVCAACHSMNLLSYRNLSEAGGPEFPVSVMEAIAAEAQFPKTDDDGNTTDENGVPLTRPGRPDDRFKAPYENELRARASNNGALPPDLSVINKARHYGADYVYDLLAHGYVDPPADVTLTAGMSYNKYFPGGQIAMFPPLSEDRVTYQDGTKATVEQLAKDVVQFLEWAGEPKMEARKRLGLQTMIYLTILALLLYISYRRVWRNVKH